MTLSKLLVSLFLLVAVVVSCRSSRGFQQVSSAASSSFVASSVVDSASWERFVFEFPALPAVTSAGDSVPFCFPGTLSLPPFALPRLVPALTFSVSHLSASRVVEANSSKDSAVAHSSKGVAASSLVFYSLVKNCLSVVVLVFVVGVFIRKLR